MKPEGQVCEDCVHFYQHYVKKSNGVEICFVEVLCGHCPNPRQKKRWKYSPACPLFEPRQDGE